MSVKRMRPASKSTGDARLRLLIPTVAVVAAFAVVLIGYLFAPEEGAQGFRWGAQIATATMTLGVGLISTAVVSFLIAEHGRDRARDEAEADRRRQELNSNDSERRRLVGELRSIHHGVKTSALRIRAHQTVKTYGVEMRDVILPKVAQLGGVISDTRGRPDLFEDSSATSLDEELSKVASYLTELTTEFEDKYIEASLLQEAAYRWRQHRVAELIAKPEFAAAPPLGNDLPEQPGQSRVWEHLTGCETPGRYRFPRLAILLELEGASVEEHDTHQDQFSGASRTAMDIIDKSNHEAAPVDTSPSRWYPWKV